MFFTHKYTYRPKKIQSQNDNENRTEGLSASKQKKALAIAKRLEKSYSEKKVDRIEKKKSKYFNSETFSKIKDKIEYLWEKLKSHETPAKMKLAIFGGFAYMILPIDVIPDSLPGLGLVDDAAVLVAIWKSCVPYFKEVAKDIIDEKGSDFISQKLMLAYKGMIVRAVCVLLMNILGTLIACFKWFGETASEYVASGVFLICFGYALYRFIRFQKRNGLMVFRIVREVIKARSINAGAANFIRNADEKVFRTISRVFQIVDAANSVSDVDIPDLERVVGHFIRKFLMQLVLFFGMYFLYIVLVYWILKPFLLNQFAGMHSWQMLVFPFYQFFSFISILFNK